MGQVTTTPSIPAALCILLPLARRGETSLPYMRRWYTCLWERSVRHQLLRQALSHQCTYRRCTATIRTHLAGDEPRVRARAPHFNLAGDSTRRSVSPAGMLTLQVPKRTLRTSGWSHAPVRRMWNVERGDDHGRGGRFPLSASAEDGTGTIWVGD